MADSNSRSALWRRITDDGSDEFCRVSSAGGRAQIHGVLVGSTAELEPFTCSYRILSLEDLTASRHLSVRYRSANCSRSLTMSRLEKGWIYRAPESTYIQADEIDVEWSPITNLFPIRRLLESAQDSITLTAAWVRLPDLRIEPSMQRYDKVDGRSVRYTNMNSGFSAIIHHDGDGFPLDYEGVWRQRAYWSNAG